MLPLVVPEARHYLQRLFDTASECAFSQGLLAWAWVEGRAPGAVSGRPPGAMLG